MADSVLLPGRRRARSRRRWVVVTRFGAASRPSEGKIRTTLGGGYPFRCCFPATRGQDPDHVGWQLPDSEPFTFARRRLKPHLMEDNTPQSGNHHPTAPADPTTPPHPGARWQYCAVFLAKSAQICHLTARRDPGRAASRRPGPRGRAHHAQDPRCSWCLPWARLRTSRKRDSDSMSWSFRDSGRAASFSW